MRRSTKHGRTKIPHVRREIDEKEGGKRVGKVNDESSFSSTMRETRRFVERARARAKVKYDDPEEIWSDRTARSYESNAEEALAILTSRYFSRISLRSSSGHGRRSDVVSRWAHSKFVPIRSISKQLIEQCYAKMN